MTSETTKEEKLLTRPEVAAMLKLKPQTLSKWAMTGRCLPVVKLGRKVVRYRLSDVQKLIQGVGAVEYQAG